MQTIYNLIKYVFGHLVKPFITAYMKIAEPRVRRLIYFVIYLLLTGSGLGMLFNPPASLVKLLGGPALVYVVAIFIMAGAIVCMFCVLPGIWWFERVGLYSIAFGIAMYSGALLFLGASAFIIIVPLIVILLLTLRWLDIKEFLLAPREG